ncbi:MAG: hypothetical protein HKN27_02260 [Silicimonas sp.]|nr:hypothetical protein [Silicimonas sp.]
MKALFPFIASLAFASTAAAQTMPEVVGAAGDYQVMKAANYELCFATRELTSNAGKLMVYSYYATKPGQRWNVAGYASETELEDGTIEIAVTIDGTETIRRKTETSGSDFLLPFEVLPELEAHEALVKTGETMTIAIGDRDTVDVPLDTHRLALEAMADCMAGF